MPRLSFLCLSLLSASGVSAAGQFNWTSITPSKSLEYTPCYDEFKCARLEVPLDWLDESDDATISIAVVKLPATVPVSDPSFGGTIITNPGGPGGSGVELLLRSGKHLQYVADGAKHYEILSFDPRGMGRSAPVSDCYQDEFAREAGLTEKRGIGSFEEGDGVLRRTLARAKAFGQLCDRGEGSENIRNFVSTSSVARDMVEIVDRIEEEKNQKSISQFQDNTEAPLGGPETTKKVPRLQYFGFSYGTVLGNYFASMFPGRVGRMVLNGVEDVLDYYNVTWALNLKDTEKTVEYFYQTCFNASATCPLFHEGDEKPEDIKGRVDRFLDELQDAPAPFTVPGQTTSITTSDVLSPFISSVYSPLQRFPKLAATIAEAMRGDFTLVYNDLSILKPQDGCPLQAPDGYTWSDDASISVRCGDGLDQRGMSVEQAREYVEQLRNDSVTFGSFWAQIRLQCVGWPFRPKYSFSGPFTTPEADPAEVEGRPAAPILFATSRYDPVTPLANALAMSRMHPGSRVLIEESVGHCAFGVPSLCTKKHFERYFETGQVPPTDVVCPADCTPFQPCRIPWESDGAEGSVFALHLTSKSRLPLSII